MQVNLNLAKLIGGALKVLLSDFEVVVESLNLRLGFVSFQNGHSLDIVLNFEILLHRLQLSLCLFQVFLSLKQRLLVVGNLEGQLLLRLLRGFDLILQGSELTLHFVLLPLHLLHFGRNLDLADFQLLLVFFSLFLVGNELLMAVLDHFMLIFGGLQRLFEFPQLLIGLVNIGFDNSKHFV